MSTNKSKNKGDSNSSFNILKLVKVLLVSILIIIISGGIVLGGVVLSILKDVEDIDPSMIATSMDQTSTIYDNNGKLLEEIQTLENRIIVGLDKMPKNLQNAFVAIEDERFYSHPGVDIIGIGSSMIDNLKAGRVVRGASTLTQQLARNVYMDHDEATDVSYERKIKEIYMALQIEQIFTKDQILEAYLNKVNLGQGAYGVQAAAQKYFSKDVSELTLAESAIFAGIVKSPTNYPPYKRIPPSEFDSETMTLVGQTEILGQVMYLIYNPNAVERQHIVLEQMHKLGYITDEEKNEALAQDIKTSLKPGQVKHHSLTSYFIDYTQTQASQALAKHYGISYSEAQQKLLTGGYKVYSTIDVEMQTKLEAIYNDFNSTIRNIAGSSKSKPLLVDWRLDKSGNVMDGERVLYYKRGNIFNDSLELVLPASNYEITDEGLTLKSNIFRAANDKIMIADTYAVNEDNNMVIFSATPIGISNDSFRKNEDGSITIFKDFLDNMENFYRVDENGVLYIPEEFAQLSHGIVQPQSATVIMDHSTGEIKALVGGRDVTGNKILNRATDSQRQPGSAIKPVSVYYPLVAEGYGAGTPVDDIPRLNKDGGKAWPRNDYGTGVYYGKIGFRKALEVSSNAGTVNALEEILTIPKSLEYLEKMGMYVPYDSNLPKEEQKRSSIVDMKTSGTTGANDENAAALALGGMTNGVTPLEITAGFATMANDGLYIEPKAFTKILDSNDNVVIENKGNVAEVSSPQAAYIMKDLLKSVATNGFYAKQAKLPNMATAGKTGTTQEEADVWFVGFTPYYTIGTWIGNDSPKITLNTKSKTAASFWKIIATSVHEGLEPIAEFEKPEGIVEVKVCAKSGKLPTGKCGGDVITEIYEEGKVPTEKCDQHVSVTVCGVSGRLATKWCPDATITGRTFFKREPEYKASEHGNIYPRDYSSNPPTGYCNIHTEEKYNSIMQEWDEWMGRRPLSSNND